MAKKLRNFATPDEKFMCAPVALPDIAAKQFEIKQHLVTMVQWNQFDGSASEDINMHLHTFTAACHFLLGE